MLILTSLRTRIDSQVFLIKESNYSGNNMYPWFEILLPVFYMMLAPIVIVGGGVPAQRSNTTFTSFSLLITHVLFCGRWLDNEGCRSKVMRRTRSSKWTVQGPSGRWRRRNACVKARMNTGDRGMRSSLFRLQIEGLWWEWGAQGWSRGDLRAKKLCAEYP